MINVFKNNFALEDKIYRLKDIYRRLPNPIREFSGKMYRSLPVDLRFGKSYSETVKEIEKTNNFSKSEIETYQLEKLNFLLKHCATNIPYYKDILGNMDSSYTYFNDLQSLMTLPLISKEVVRENNKIFRATNLPSKLHLHMNTGGSTGIPLDLYYEKGVSRSREWAFIHDIWRRVGWNDGDKSVMLRGWSIPGSKYWQFEPIRNRLIMSAFHLNSNTIPLYLEAIRDFKPAFIEAYPSNISIIADYLLRNNLPPVNSLKGILLGSENLFPHQRKLIEKAFNCRVLSWYGHGEICALGGECECSTDYHMFPSYGITELIDTKGNQITKPGILGEIVATGFNNLVMPLLRYRTGDMGVFSGGTCNCERQWQRLSRVEGRKQELVVAADGSVITLTALIFGQHYEAFGNIVRMQLAQKLPGEITIRIEPSEKYSRKRDEKEIIGKIDSAVGSSFQINFEYPDSISRSSSGKHIFLEQTLIIDDYLQ